MKNSFGYASGVGVYQVMGPLTRSRGIHPVVQKVQPVLKKGKRHPIFLTRNRRAHRASD
ncbi:MAG TPA: hypothetical protein VHA71_09745 [Rhodanobacteraceae bacterium]|nr:hypothetical protein [Rhodanobacteraceae bacterium]